MHRAHSWAVVVHKRHYYYVFNDNLKEYLHKWSLHSVGPAVLLNQCCSLSGSFFFLFMFFARVQLYFFCGLFFLAFTPCCICFIPSHGTFYTWFCEGQKLNFSLHKCFNANTLRDGSCLSFPLGHWVNCLKMPVKLLVDFGNFYIHAD